MLSRLPARGRVHLLLAISAFAVAYVRENLQYGRSGWESLQALAASWAISLIGLALLAAVCSVLINMWNPYIFPNESEYQDLSMDRTVFHVAVIALVTAIAMLLMAHASLGDTYGY